MCDYSLEHTQSRPAAIGDKLVTTGFPNSITKGFAAVGKPGVAVCVRPGTELSFERGMETAHVLGFFPTRKLSDTTAIFRRVNPRQVNVHHDALETPSGKVVMLNSLVPGQVATVLQVPRTDKPAEEVIEQAPVVIEQAPVEELV